MNDRLLGVVEGLNNRITNVEERMRDNEKDFDHYKEKNNEVYMAEIAKKLDHYNIKDGMWYFDNYPTGIPAQGPKGEPFTYEDFTEEQLKKLVGPKGDPLTFDDLTPEQIVLLTGADGLDGKDGKDGKDGYTPVKGKDYFDGKDGKDGKDAPLPNIKIGEVKAVSTFDKAGATITRDGQDFVLNLDVPRGRPGANGSNGTDGSNGMPGKTGPKGDPGTSPTATVERIENGARITITDDNGTTTADISDGEVTQAQLDETNKDLDYYKTIYNAMPKLSGEGTEATIDDTSESILKLGLSGNTYQDSTTGKNLFARLNDGTYTIYGVTAKVENGIITLNGTSNGEGYYPFVSGLSDLLNGTYTLSINNSGSVSGGNLAIIVASGSTYLITRNQTANSITSTLSNKTISSYGLYMNNGLTFTNFVIKPQLEDGSTATDYEPYTGGIASPNPDYPQDIEVVTGDNEIVITGKNLLNRATCEENKLIRWVEGDTYNETGSLVSDYIRVNAGDTIYSTYGSQKCFYDKNKNYIGTLQIGGTVILSGSGADTKSFFTVPDISNIYYLRLGFRASYATGTNLLTANIMVNKGTALATYEPYKEQVYPINLGSLGLCKIRDYKDSFRQSTGKNLFNIDILEGSPNMTISNGKLILEGSTAYHASEVGINLKNIADLKVGETYYLNFKTTYAGGNYNAIYLRGTTSYWNSGTAHTITQAELDDRIAFYGTDNSEISEIIISKENIDYEPYGVGTWYKHAEIGKVVLDGSENWIQNTSYNTVYLLEDFLKDAITNEPRPMMSDYFTYGGVVTQGSGSVEIGKFYQWTTIPQRVVLGFNSTSLNDFKTWLSTHNTEVYYPLETPTNEEITDTNLINQLNAIKYALAHKDQTNISQTNNEQPFIIDYETLYDMQKLVNRVAELEVA